MSSISKVIAMINRLEDDGVIERYAIGGAVGATFYLEPVATLDVDIFVVFRPEAGRSLLSLQPIFDYLTARGGVIEGEYVVIAGWPVVGWVKRSATQQSYRGRGMQYEGTVNGLLVSICVFIKHLQP